MAKKSSEKVLTSDTEKKQTEFSNPFVEKESKATDTKIQKTVDEITKQFSGFLGNLRDRWQDEKEHEDFKEYEAAAKKALDGKIEGVKFVKLTKSPFAAYLDFNGMSLKLVVKAKSIDILVLKEKKGKTIPAAVVAEAEKHELPAADVKLNDGSQPHVTASSNKSAPVVKKTAYMCPKCGSDTVEKPNKNSQSMTCMACGKTANVLAFLPKIAKKTAVKKVLDAKTKTAAKKAVKEIANAKPKSSAAVKEHKARDGKPTVASVLRQCFRDGMDNEAATTAARKILGEDKVKNWYASWYRNEMKRKGIA